MLIFIRVAGEKTFLYSYEEPTLGFDKLVTYTKPKARPASKSESYNGIHEIYANYSRAGLYFLPMMLGIWKYTSDKAPKRVFAQVHHLHNDQQAASSREW